MSAVNIQHAKPAAIKLTRGTGTPMAASTNRMNPTRSKTKVSMPLWYPFSQLDMRGSLIVMGQGQGQGDWLRRPNGTAEMLNEGDGNWLLRSAMNRDRTLRLTGKEMEEVAMLVIAPGSLVAAPELVSRDGR